MYNEDTYTVRHLLLKSIEREFPPPAIVSLVIPLAEELSRVILKNSYRRFPECQIGSVYIGQDPANSGTLVITFLDNEGEVMEWDH